MATLSKMNDTQKIKYAQFVKTYYPADYAYYEAKGAFLNNQQIAGFWDFLRGAGNFVAGIFGSGVQDSYQQFVNWEQTGATPANAQPQLTQEQILMLQKQAVDDALEEQSKENFKNNMPLYAILAFLAFKVLK